MRYCLFLHFVCLPIFHYVANIPICFYISVPNFMSFGPITKKKSTYKAEGPLKEAYFE